MPNKILTPLQSLVSCFLEPPVNRRAAVGATEGLWRGYSSVCPKGTLCWALVAVTQAGGGFSVPTLPCSKNQASENSTSQIASKFSSRLRRGFLGTSFPLLSPLFLPLFLPGRKPDQNPGYPVQALRSYCKNSVRDKAISGR